MGDWIARVVRFRTTRDGRGRACGIVTGMGATPQVALAELRREAEELAQQAGQADEEAAQKADQEAAQRAAQGADERRRQQAAKEARRPAQGPGPKGHPVAAEPRGPDGELIRVVPGTSRPPRVVPSSTGPREWRYEVVDVRLTPAPMKGGGSGWLAYGTLAREGHPQRASTTGAGSGGSDGGSRDDPGGRGGRDDPGGRGGRDDPGGRGGRDDPGGRGGRGDLGGR